MNKNSLEETRELNKQSAKHKDSLTKNATDASLKQSKKVNKTDANEMIIGLSKDAVACMSSSSIDIALQEKQNLSKN